MHKPRRFEGVLSLAIIRGLVALCFAPSYIACWLMAGVSRIGRMYYLHTACFPKRGLRR